MCISLKFLSLEIQPEVFSSHAVRVKKSTPSDQSDLIIHPHCGVSLITGSKWQQKECVEFLIALVAYQTDL